MHDTDEWGRDPSVRKMRGIFSRMESAQGDLLKLLGIPPLDQRLKPARAKARDLFVRAGSLPASRNPDTSDADLAALYVHCLARALEMAGIKVPTDKLSDGENIAAIVREVAG